MTHDQIKEAMGETAFQPQLGSHEEVASHSAVLTNIRISNRLQMTVDAKIAAWYRPTFENVLSYFAQTYGLFDEAFELVEVPDLREIVSEFTAIWMKLHSGALNTKSMVDMWEICIGIDRINRILRANMQRWRYFFRTSTQTPRKMEEVLRILDEGGGFFGGKAKQKEREKAPSPAPDDASSKAPPSLD